MNKQKKREVTAILSDIKQGGGGCKMDRGVTGLMRKTTPRCARFRKLNSVKLFFNRTEIDNCFTIVLLIAPRKTYRGLEEDRTARCRIIAVLK